jgi:hypothetical protein
MHLQLSEDQARELDALLETTLGDLSYEIAASDNARFRSALSERRRLLLGLDNHLKAVISADDDETEAPVLLMEELAHPGG